MSDPMSAPLVVESARRRYLPVDEGAGEGGGLFANPYRLAAYWADTVAQPLSGQRGVADELCELAVMSTLADWLRRWLPIHVHAALLGGASLPAVAAAAGVAPSALRGLWESWAAGQVELWQTSNPHRRLGVSPQQYAKVRDLFDTEFGTEFGPTTGLAVPS